MGFTTRCLYAPRAFGGSLFQFERTDAFSISCWFKITQAFPTAGADLVQKRRQYDGTSVYRGWRFLVNGGDGSSSYGLGSLQLNLWNSYTGSNRLSVRGNTTVADGRWHHGIATYDGSSTPAGIKLYLNGALQTMTTVYNTLTGTIVEPQGIFYLGRNEGETSITEGLAAIDEVSIYNRVLSAAEVTWIYNGKVPRDLLGAGAPTGIQAWWRCGEEGEPFPVVADSAVPALFPLIPDVSQLANHATAVNMTLANIVSDVPGRVSEGPDTPGTYIWRSLTFNGTNQYINCGNLSGFDEIAFAGQIKFQIACWFKTTTYGIIMAKMQNAVPYGFCLEICEGADHPPYGITPGVIRISLINTPGATEAVAETQVGGFHDGQWHFLSVYVNHYTFGWGSVSLGVDGFARTHWINSDTLLGASIANSASLYIGDRQSDQGTKPFEGTIAAVMTFNAAVSTGTWYGKTLVNDLPMIYPKTPEPAYTALQHWWPLGEGRPCHLRTTGETSSSDTKSQLAPGGIHGAPATLIKYGLPPVPATPGPAFMYLKRARDIGSGPPAVYTEWTSTDINSSPPTLPPVGPWDEIVVISKWRI